MWLYRALQAIADIICEASKQCETNAKPFRPAEKAATGKWRNSSSSAGNLCFLCSDLLISSAGLRVKAKLLRDQMEWITLNWDMSDCIQAKKA